MNDELRELILSHFDEMSFLDFLGLSLPDLVEAFEDNIKENLVEFQAEVGQAPD